MPAGLVFVPSGGGGGSVPPTGSTNFTNASPSPLALKAFAVGDILTHVSVSVIAPFDPGFTVTIGYPAAPTAIFAAGEVDLQTVGVYETSVYRVSAVPETLTAYFAGISAAGSGTIFYQN